MTRVYEGTHSFIRRHRRDKYPHNQTIIQLGRHHHGLKKGKCIKGSPYSINEHRVPEMIPVLGSQPAGDVSQS